MLWDSHRPEFTVSAIRKPMCENPTADAIASLKYPDSMAEPFEFVAGNKSCHSGPKDRHHLSRLPAVGSSNFSEPHLNIVCHRLPTREARTLLEVCAIGRSRVATSIESISRIAAACDRPAYKIRPGLTTIKLKNANSLLAFVDQLMINAAAGFSLERYVWFETNHALRNV